MSTPKPFFGVLLVLGAAVLWGTTGTIQAFLPEARDPLLVAGFRMVFGAATLFVLAALAQGAFAGFRQLPWGWVLAAAASIAAYNLLFFKGVLGAGVGVGTVLAIGGAPIWVTLFTIVVLRRRPDRITMFGQGLSITGAALLVLSGGSESSSLSGIILSILAGAAYAAYSTITSKIRDAAPSVTVAAATFGMAAVLVVPVFFIAPLNWALALSPMALLIFLGVVVTGLSYALYTKGLQTVPAASAVTLALAEPLTAWLLATFLVGEANTPAKMAGAALLIAGLYVVSQARPAD
ncbi:MAG: DMT family transporter [Paracoccaceae bacterium]|nr:DMT family transporter [Paracoccaceae bacterium]MDG1371881.1 DMT family transporter [Paracoccaceae bacterium]